MKFADNTNQTGPYAESFVPLNINIVLVKTKYRNIIVSLLRCVMYLSRHNIRKKRE